MRVFDILVVGGHSVFRGDYSKYSAMGPPRQATGPPRSGAAMRVAMLSGYHDVSWKSQRLKH